MSTGYVFSEKAALATELVGLAKQLKLSPVTAIAFSDEQATALANCGADGIVKLSGDAEIPENNAKALAAWLAGRFESDPGLFLVGASPVGRDLAARTAGYLDCGLSADILSAEVAGGGICTSRAQYGGAVVLSETLALPAVITVPAGRSAAAEGSAAVTESAELEADTRVKLESTEPIVKEGVDLAKAKCIVGVGMGLGAKEDLALIEALADKINGGIGCSRGIAEERRWVSAEQYLGLSGLTVSPDLYVAVGISGQVQHMVGVRDSKIIVAINKNEDAAIFKYADYGLVGDLYELVPALTEALA